MKTSIIRQRVADFLKKHPPFEVLSDNDLLDIAGTGRVRFHESEEYLFRQGEKKGQFVWMVQQGKVELLDERASGEQLRDVLGEGDLLGMERFSIGGCWVYSARTASDVIVYCLPAEALESLAPRYPRMKQFLSARLSVKGNAGFVRTSWLDAQAPPPEFFRARLAAPVDAGGFDRSVAHPGPPAVATPLTVRAAVREMLRAGREELLITAGGTLDRPLAGIVTAAELALFCGENPVGMVGMIRRAASPAEIAPLRQPAMRMLQGALAQPEDVDDCCRIARAFAAALADACMRMARRDVLATGMEPPGIACCLILFGAAARGDMMWPELPRIAVVYDDSEEQFRPEDSLFFTALAGETMARFHACGLASTECFSAEGAGLGIPLSEWRALYSDTISKPPGHDLYARSEFFDLWPVSGDDSIARKLLDHIEATLLEDEMKMIPSLAADTLGHLPPLTFFRGMVLELDGAVRDSFNVDSAALSPIAAAARVFAIAKLRVTPASTLDRLGAAALDYPQRTAIFREAADAFRIALYYRSLAGGAQIRPVNLGKFDQLLLKGAFSSIQRLLELTASTFIATA